MPALLVVLSLVCLGTSFAHWRHHTSTDDLFALWCLVVAVFCLGGALALRCCGG